MTDWSDVGRRYEEANEHKRWGRELKPIVGFDPRWGIVMIPPGFAAVSRMIVEHGERKISIYFDGYGRLGSCSVPYYEVYQISGPGHPDHTDVDRFVMGRDEGEMMDLLKKLLNRDDQTDTQETQPCPPD